MNDTTPSVPHVHVLTGGVPHAKPWALLRCHIGGALRRGVLTLSTDLPGEGGDDFSAALARADAVVALLSAANYASAEIEDAAAACWAAGVRFVPVVVGRFPVELSQFTKLKVTPESGPMSDDTTAVEVTRAVRAVAEAAHRRRSAR